MTYILFFRTCTKDFRFFKYLTARVVSVTVMKVTARVIQTICRDFIMFSVSGNPTFWWTGYFWSKSILLRLADYKTIFFLLKLLSL